MIGKEEAAVGGRGKAGEGEGWKTKGGVKGHGIAFEGRGLVVDREEGDGGCSEHVSRSRHGWKLDEEVKYPIYLALFKK